MKEESNEFKLINYDLHKTGHLFYKKLFQRWLRSIPYELLINELKRRKIVKIDWNTGKIVKK